MGATSAIMKFRGALSTFLVLAIYHTVLAERPVDSESRVNESTYFNCSSSITTKEIHWYHYPVGVEAHERKSVYAFGKFYKDYEEDFELDKNSSSGVYNLVIRSVKRSYAGRYECQDNGGQGNSCSAQLIVLDANPDCVSNINPAGVIGPNECGIAPEDLHLSCSVAYHGNIPPKLKWSRVGENESISENVTEKQSASQITYNVTVRANLLVDNSSYECQTTNSRTSKHSCTTETLKLLYISGTSSVSEKNISEVVHCSANTSSQFCEYRWYNKDDSQTLSNNRTFKLQKAGHHRCEATCKLRNMQCMVNASLINAQHVSNNDPTGSSSTGVVVGAVVALLVILIFVILLGLLFYIRRRRSPRHREERKVEVGANEVPENYPQEAYPLLETSEVEEGKKLAPKADVQDVKKQVVGNSSHEMQPLILGGTEKNPILISDNEENEVKDMKDILEEEHPEKRRKTEEPRNKENINYDLHPMLLHVESFNGAEDEKTSISGLTMLNKELFVVFEKTSEVKVFQAIAFTHVRSLAVMDLDSPLDIVSSPVNNCLYISSANSIYKVDGNGKIFEKWPIEDGGGTLSVTSNQTVILCVWKRTALREFSANGIMCHEVKFPSDVRPFHAVKINIDQFVVSYECRMVHSVCTVNMSGNIVQSFSGMLRFPKYLAVDSDGYVIVAELQNSRVLMMSPNLKFSKVLLSDKDEICRPLRICLDEANSQMFVADVEGEARRFMVFKLQKQKTATKADVKDVQTPLMENFSQENYALLPGTTEDNATLTSDTSGIEDKDDVFQDAQENVEESPVTTAPNEMDMISKLTYEERNKNEDESREHKSKDSEVEGEETRTKKRKR